MDKPFKSLDEQVDILINRNLIIHSKDRAKYLLTKNSYYSVINGYKGIFLKQKIDEKEEDVFEDNTTLEDIFDLYFFDKRIRNEIISALGSVEGTLSSNIAYILAERFGEREEDYLNEKNFKLGRKTNNGKYEREILIHELKKICQSEEHPMKHYRVNHKNVPPWIIVKGATLGNLVYIYKLFKKDEKDYLISRCLGIVANQIDENLKQFFSKLLDVFRKYRNWAAHGGRIYSHRVREELPYYEPAYNRFGFEKTRYNTGQGKSDVFALMVALAFFLQSDRQAYIFFMVGIPFHLKTYSEKNPEYYMRVLKKMGIPLNYHEALSEAPLVDTTAFLENVNYSGKDKVLL